MTDAFAVLGLERRPGLTAREVEMAFLRSPDLGKSTAANEAQRILRDPVLRLRHLLELEEGDIEAPSATGALPEEAAALFAEIAPLLHECAELQKKIDASVAMLERAALMPEIARMSARLQGLLNRLEEECEALDSAARTLDSDWLVGRKTTAPVAGLLRRRVFLQRWQHQINERLFRLTAAG